MNPAGRAGADGLSGRVGSKKKRRERLGIEDRPLRREEEAESPLGELPEALHLGRFMETHSVEHIPVLFEPVLQALAGLANSNSPVILDGTLGEAGHTRGMLRLRPEATVIALDRDALMLERARKRLTDDGFELSDRPKQGAVCTVHAPFSDAAAALAQWGLSVDFLLCDFGVAMFHFSGAGRGFSFRDDDLDMRLDDRLTVTAADLLNRMPEDRLSLIFFEYGEERQARAIARAIVAARPIGSASQLTDVVLSVLIRKRNQTGRRDYIRDSDAARVFQALRIAVNGEIDQIEDMLASLPAVLAPRGRAALISFHSLEDRPVKKRFQTLAHEGFRILTKKAIVPSEAELALNVAARSAKLRVLERDKSE